jgi:putative transposase
MSRSPRIVVPGIPHHVTHRGNNRGEVFRSDDDRWVYLHCLQTQSEKFGLQTVAYCLMTNHVHLIGVPGSPESLSKAVGRAHRQYANYFNETHERCGHLWQDRFYSTPLDEAHAWDALRYVEQNPVRAGLAAEPWEYAWSSAAAHCGLAKGPRLLDMAGWWERHTPEEWRDALRTRQEEGVARMFSEWTVHGRPIGDESFLDTLEALLGRSVRARRPGRPKKLVPGTDL